jgi:hypothetical protein
MDLKALQVQELKAFKVLLELKALQVPKVLQVHRAL